MGNTGLVAHRYQSLAILLFAVATMSAGIVSSCGSGGSSNGGLCEQCGVSPDGPCQPKAFVVLGATQPEPCPSPGQPNQCIEVDLICRRKVDSAQQRCYPASAPGVPNPQFRCDGSRPGGTVLPEPTLTPTPTGSTNPTPTKTFDANAVCGNGIVEGTEQCDGTDFGGLGCGNFCADNTGVLNCSGCIIDTSRCTGGNCRGF